jgi:hypothetical protein
MLKVTDSTGIIQETVPSELIDVVGVWADMLGSKHSKDNDEAVLSFSKTMVHV